MDKYTATEQAFKHGYEKGYAAGKKDAVEVIRCKECEYWIFTGDGFGDCTHSRFHLDDCADPTMEAEGFCSNAERRNNG